MIDSGYDFHILTADDKKIEALRKSMTIQEMINVPIRDFYTLMRRYTKRDQGNYKKMSVFSHDHLIISSSEGLHYLDMKNPDKEPLMVNATEMIKKLDKTRYFKEIKNFAVS